MASVLLVFRLIVINNVIKIAEEMWHNNEPSDFTGQIAITLIIFPLSHISMEWMCVQGKQ